MIRKHWQTLVLWGIALGLFLIPNIFWGDLYIVGGDDSRLYYLYPLKYLKNFSFNVMSNNTLGGNLGYFPVSYSAPTVAFFYILKQLLPAMNTQLFAYGAILAFGFIFFYRFLREMVTGKSPWYFLSAVTASLFYIFSPYVTRTFFQYQVISIFLLAVVPGGLYLFVAGVKQKRMAFIVISALLYSVFSSTVFTLPWFLPVIFTLIPFFVFLGWRYGWHAGRALGVFIAVTVLSNLYWIIHFIIPMVYKTGEAALTSSLSSVTFKTQNADIIYALSFLNSPVSQIVNYLRTSWSARQGIGLVDSLGAAYLLIILAAGVLLANVKKYTRLLYVTSVFGLLLAMMFITPNFGQWNVVVFQFFNAHVPFFGMFRNMYDKFSLAMAFGYAFAFFAALVVIGEAKIRYRFMLPAILLLFTIFQGIPYIHPFYNDDQYSTRVSGKMNQDFLDLTAYLKNMQTSSRFIWLPMTFPGYIYIGDEQNPNHFYAGLSPLQLLSKKSDIAGFYGIGTSADPELHWKLLELLKNNLYEDIGRILGTQNIGYVIVNREILPPEGRNALNGFYFLDLQTEEFFITILGRKIQDFGNRYSLYTINEKFFIPTVSGASAFQKLPDGSYEVTVTDTPTQIILREPYNRLWKIEHLPPPQATADGFGNAWEIDRPGQYRIDFWPRKLVWPAVITSAAAIVGSLLYIFIFSKRK